MQPRLRPAGAVGALSAAAAACTLLAGCFTTSADFRRDAETFIRDSVAPELDTSFQSVSCTKPVNQDVGTRFACEALDAEGGVWEFDNVIDAPGEFTVNVSRRP
ncbi:MAG: hypothetical protein HKN44_01180 [Ilumatobacter sp.]|nr:hypothetical protein [Ilumatobacter sp.]